MEISILIWQKLVKIVLMKYKSLKQHSHQLNLNGLHRTFHTKISSVQLLSCVQLFATPWTVACQASLSMNSPGKNTGVGCHTLLQWLFPTQGSNPGVVKRDLLSIMKRCTYHPYLSVLQLLSRSRDKDKIHNLQ